jgi:hypothetical protein
MIKTQHDVTSQDSVLSIIKSQLAACVIRPGKQLKTEVVYQFGLPR